MRARVYVWCIACWDWKTCLIHKVLPWLLAAVSAAAAAANDDDDVDDDYGGGADDGANEG